MGTAWIIVAVVSGVIAIASYFVGVRQGKAWGQVAVVVFVILAVGGVFCRQLKVGSRGPRGEPFKRMRLVGEGLEGKLPEGAKVFVFREAMLPDEGMPGMGPMPPPMPEGDPGMPSMKDMVKQQEEGWQKKLSAAAGVNVVIVGSGPPATQYPGMSYDFPGTAAEFSAALDKYPDIDCWITLIGLPRNMQTGEWELEMVSTYERDKPPLVGAHVSSFFDPAQIRKLVQDGKLTAVVIMPSLQSPDQVTITKDNLDQLPAKAPMDSTMMAPPPMGPPPAR